MGFIDYTDLNMITKSRGFIAVSSALEDHASALILWEYFATLSFHELHDSLAGQIHLPELQICNYIRLSFKVP